MKITYLDHSGFTVELGQWLLAFDVWNPNADAAGKGILVKSEVASHEKSALMLSHSHYDHYCKEALELPFGHVILSEDFPGEIGGVRMAVGAEQAFDGMTVRTFGSTDMGVSFLADVCGKRIFHAGDYNLWHWEDESTQEEIDEATQWFEDILETLKPYAGSIDVAFFPLDPRMGANTARGMERFLDVMQPKLTIPMHCQGDEALPKGFAAAHENVRAMCTRGEVLEV